MITLTRAGRALCPARYREHVMTVEDPRRMRIAGQVAAQVAGAGWDVASYRCPCGFAGDDASEFDRHLDAVDDAGLEHFEVLDGWTPGAGEAVAGRCHHAGCGHDRACRWGLRDGALRGSRA